MNLSGLLQFILGFIIGVVLLLGTSAATAYYFFTKLSVAPPKPIFNKENSPPATTEASEPASSTTLTEAAPTPTEGESEPATEPAVVQEESPTPSLAERLGPNAYKARVTWPQGLSLRSRPSLDAERVGGIYYNDEIYVLEESADGNWQKIYIPESEQEAWVKSGNMERVAQ